MDFLGSSIDPCYIQNCLIMNCVIKRLGVVKREKTWVGFKMIKCGNFSIKSCCQGDSIRYPQHDSIQN